MISKKILTQNLHVNHRFDNTVAVLGHEIESLPGLFQPETVRHHKVHICPPASNDIHRRLDAVVLPADVLYGKLLSPELVDVERDVTFEVRTDVPVYHPDVQTYEVKDADGTHLGLFYVDYFTRQSKEGGAWMGNFREQWKEGGKDIRPIIYNVCNFSKPSTGQPALLGLDEARTLFHEFGHALHGLLADGTYESLSGTNVAGDFVELPSQMMENWAFAPEVLPTYARHHESGEPIPEDLIEKLQKAAKFNQGFNTAEYLAASILDMRWHTLRDDGERDPVAFETGVMQEIGMIPEISSRYRTPYFAHIFSGGYSAGYYNYVWAEVLDADGFEVFKQKGLFDPDLALSYRKNILEAGGSEPPMDLYKRFRGAEPSIEPLLVRRGLDTTG